MTNQTNQPEEVLNNYSSDQHKLNPSDNNRLLPLLATILISGVVCGLGGYYLGQQSAESQPSETTLVTNIPSPTASVMETISPTSMPTTLASVKPSTTPNVTKPTSNLTTYTNTAFNYSISFPSSWKASDQAAGPGVSAATPRSEIVDIIDSAQPASVPYPSSVVVIQHHSQIPTLYTSWTRTDKTINGIPTRVYENTDEATTAYIFTAPEMASFMEVRFNGSKQSLSYKAFEQMVATFRFNY